MNSKSFKKIICTVLCAIMLFASAISLNASGNYTGGSSGVSSSGGIVVPPELPAEMPLNSDGIKVFVSALIKENEDKIIEKVNGVDGDFKLRSINDIDLDLANGRVYVNLSFKYHYKVHVLGIPVSDSINGKAKIIFDLLVRNDNSKIAVRFVKLDNLDLSNILYDLLKKLLNIKDLINGQLAGEFFGQDGEDPSSYKLFNSNSFVDVLNTQLQKALKGKEIGIEKPIKGLDNQVVAYAKILNDKIRFNSFDIVNTGIASVHIEFELGIKSNTSPSVNSSVIGSFDIAAKLLLKTADTSIWGHFEDISNLKLSNYTLNQENTSLLNIAIKASLSDQKLCSAKSLF